MTSVVAVRAGVLIAALALLPGCATVVPQLAASAVASALAAAVPDAGPPEEPPAPPIDWASAADDCGAQLRVLHDAARAGSLAADSAPPFALLIAEEESRASRWLDDGSSFIELDLPLRVGPAAVGPGSAPCLIRVGPARELTVDRAVVGEEVVPSEYQSGTRTQRNPEYEEAQARVREAERELNDQGGADILKVGDPMLDLIGVLVGGVITGFSDHGDQEELEEAMEELAATPRSLDQPVLRPYHFERTVIHGRKAATVPVALLDQAGRELRRTEIRQHEERRFHVLDGLHPRDLDYQEHRAQSITPRALKQWDRLPPRLTASSIVAALADDPVDGPPTVASAGAPHDPAMGDGSPGEAVRSAAWSARSGMDATAVPETEERPSGPRPLTADAPKTPLLDLGTVRIGVGGGGAGNGFYVAPHLVVTAESLVRGASLVDVTTANGDTVLGLVAARDATRGLALVHVPKPGAPVVLEGDPLARPLRAVPAGGPGTPVFRGAGVAGMVGADGAKPGLVPAAAISTFLAEQGKVTPAPPQG